jgi:hypothetical protein
VKTRLRSPALGDKRDGIYGIYYPPALERSISGCALISQQFNMMLVASILAGTEPERGFKECATRSAGPSWFAQGRESNGKLGRSSVLNMVESYRSRTWIGAS